MGTSLVNFVNDTLPMMTKSSVTYNSERNMFLTTGYTSGSGHCYFQGIQLSERVGVVYDIGRGGWGSNPLFLNGVTVYCFDGRDKKIIGKWSPCDYAFYSDNLAKRIAKELLFNYLKSQIQIQGISISTSELEKFASAQIEAASERKCLN
jgi:hypothetical protein